MTNNEKWLERAHERCREDLVLWQTLTKRLRASREELTAAKRAVEAEQHQPLAVSA